MRNPILIILLNCLCLNIWSQIEATLTIENQNTVGTDFYFDLYLYRSSGISSGDIYLKDADFYLTFNRDNFNNPAISKVGSSPGHCTLKPSSNQSNDQLFTSISYFNSTQPSLNNDQIIIELNGPVPDNQQVFDTRVAKINNSTSTHCLGRFKISGINNPFGTAGLKWKTSGSSLVTTVSSMENFEPFFGSEIEINAINPVDASLPVELISFTADIFEENQIKLDWITAFELDNLGFEVEKRIAEDQWKKIGFIPGGQAQAGSTYYFIDLNPTKGINYYRLKQMDFDGHFTYSNIVSIYFSSGEGIDVFPNPVSRLLYVEGTIDGSNFQIISNAGLDIMNGRLTGEPIDVSGLPAGIYILKSENKSSKFLKW